MIIEQQQIFTTQNLATFFEALNLTTALRSSLPKMAEACFSFICSKQQMKIDDFHARLTMKKNTAYSWRQMIFYLSLMDTGGQLAFMTWATQHLDQQAEAFRLTFLPIFKGLKQIIDLGSNDGGESMRPFLGWGR